MKHDRGIVNWAELPKEMCASIGKHLDNGIDVLRFRSVCKSWRSSIPPVQNTVPLPLPLEFPGPRAFTTVRLSQPKIYHLQPPLQDYQTPTSNPSPSQGWLVKLEESLFSGKMRSLDPISNCQIHDFPPASAKALNLLDFRVAELIRSYALEFFFHVGFDFVFAVKVAVLSHNSWSTNNFAQCAIMYVGLLGFWKLGETKWSFIDGEKFFYHDVVSYNGKFYAIDKLGSAYWIDPSLNAIQFSPPLPDLDGLNRKQKHLIESCGDLYLVDRFLDKERLAKDSDPDLDGYVDDDHFLGYFVNYNLDARAFSFKVYKLEMEQDCRRWVEVKKLGDRAFFLCSDCSFSISAKEFGGFKRNCIYFSNASVMRSASYKCQVFDLDDGTISSLDYSEFFCPPSCL
ncbi:putative F-box protein At1g65770 [Ziziphus jujuba]|uniref:F-box protein At1g65770 n=1 Tax=Ziziphus jujuba TaxID=326968 RepID=A0A6P4A6L6_ZIZJJ|nr:putative F-box protein At1g65770 [Ziziphus jujuba]